ncbi:MAG: hypothetical protein QOH25_2517 [Acidobacteriota bacterium]|jgi:hypothetical protein|nr:hypothetical protein [Acidobacteriota bacterium]
MSKEVAVMRLLSVCLTVSFVFVGCGGKQANVSTNNSVTTTETKVAETREVESVSPTPTATPVRKGVTPPVEFTYLGISPDKEFASYKIKVNTAEPISQVDIGVKYMGQDGSVLEETTLAWQNIVKSVRQPIEKGKTYEVKDYFPEAATKAEYVLKRVIFQDGTRWNAGD